MLDKKKVSIGELQCGGIVLAHGSESIHGAVINAIFPVEDEVYDVLMTGPGDERKEIARDLLYNK